MGVALNKLKEILVLGIEVLNEIESLESHSVKTKIKPIVWHDRKDGTSLGIKQNVSYLAYLDSKNNGAILEQQRNDSDIHFYHFNSIDEAKEQAQLIHQEYVMGYFE